MSINKLALIRYKTIDNCLQNRKKRWTLEDLILACSDALYQYEGISSGISKRTIQLDIQHMRGDKLGYRAPIVVEEKKYYTYSEPGYSITKTPLTTQDYSTLNEVVAILRQFKGFGYFDEMNDMLTRLEHNLFKHQKRGRSYIDFEKNHLLKGLDLIDDLHRAIAGRKVLEVHYKSFKARSAGFQVVSPYLLKEYRNRWFLLAAKHQGKGWVILALDRIIGFRELRKEKYIDPETDVFHFFEDVIGVSKIKGQSPILIKLKVGADHVPYLITKPLHPSQQLLESLADGSAIFSVCVIWNFELEREILGFGEGLEVLSPGRFRAKMIKRVRESFEVYKNGNG